MRSERDDGQDGDRDERQEGADHQFAPPPAHAHEGKGERKPGRELERGRGGQRGAAQALAAGDRQVDAGHHEGDREEVVVGAPDREQQDDWVQPDEERRLERIASQLLGAAPHEPDRREAAGGGQHLQRPHRAGDAQGDDRVARDREQRAVGGGDVRAPAAVEVDRVGREVGGDGGVRIDPVQRAEPGDVDVAEHVARDQRRRE